MAPAAAPQIAALTVAGYAARIGRALRSVGPAEVEGEVQRPSASAGGALFFDLADGEAKLACKVWRQDLRRLEHVPRHGDLVRVRVDRPDLWPRLGKLDLVVSQVRLAGEGELLRRRADLLRRLEAEGLCDPARRVALPAFPRAVGVIAGRDSDGMADVVRALRDRFPPVHVVTCAALVQGVRAPLDLVDALARLEAHPLVDVVVLARGGGSVQDLVAFDDERLCRAISACRVPVVAAIGHTENVPVCNHVTWSAATPSRSPGFVVPSASELLGHLDRAGTVIGRLPLGLEAWAERGAALRGPLDRLPARVEAWAERAVSLRGPLDRLPARVEAWAERSVALGARIDLRSGLAASEARVADRGRAVERAGSVSVDARAAAVARAWAVLDRAGARRALGRRADRLEEDAARLRAALRRQVADHERDYGRALGRHLREMRSSLARGLERPAEALGRDGAEVAARALRGLGERERDLRHAVAVVEAHDLRRRGWLLAADERGRPVTSAAALSRGARLALRLRDGEARAVVERVTEHKERA